MYKSKLWTLKKYRLLLIFKKKQLIKYSTTYLFIFIGWSLILIFVPLRRCRSESFIAAVWIWIFVPLRRYGSESLSFGATVWIWIFVPLYVLELSFWWWWWRRRTQARMRTQDDDDDVIIITKIVAAQTFWFKSFLQSQFAPWFGRVGACGVLLPLVEFNSLWQRRGEFFSARA